MVAEAVGQLDLLEGFAIGLLLAFALPVRVRAIPRPRGVEFIEEVELHRGLPVFLAM
jgi:hypothetical protein